MPIKSFDRAKMRLRPALTDKQCAALARLMALEVLEKLCSVESVDRILLIGEGSTQAKLAKRFDCDYWEDDPALDISNNLTKVAQSRTLRTASRLLYVPSDIPQVSPQEISTLLVREDADLLICRARRDEGSNAMLARPTYPISFSFGRNSSKRHASAVAAYGRDVVILDVPSFERYIDVAEDLAWFCDTATSGRVIDFLRNTKLDIELCGNVLDSPSTY